MKAVKRVSVLEEPADALIYSTNVLLNMTGGVGAQLLEKFGTSLQFGLHETLHRAGKKHAAQGEIIEFVLPEMPWIAVFHAVPCDAFYHTTPEIVGTLLGRCLERCLEIGGIAKVATSALATGYGDLSLDDFVRVFESVAENPRFRDSLEVVLCLPPDVC